MSIAWCVMEAQQKDCRTRATSAAAGLLILLFCSVAAGQTFTSVTSDPDVGRFDHIVATVDLNGDGRDDLIVGDLFNNVGDEIGERLIKTPVHFLFGEEDGTFRAAPGFVDGTVEARTPIAVVDDFNNDDKLDVVVLDSGMYSYTESVGVGNPPQLFLSSPDDDRLHPSDALAEAIRHEHELRPNPDYSGPADLHLKSATAGDIDGDGDTDLWIDSIGGANVSSHFMVNNGDGTFTVDEARAPPALRHNSPEFWYHLEGHLADMDNDGDLDLVLGQNRDSFPATVNQFSVVLINDGTGNYPVRIDLPRPAFNDGFTVVNGITTFDANHDGFQDLILVHLRNNDVDDSAEAFTGRYVQVLISDGGTAFEDESDNRMGDQSATLGEFTTDGHWTLNNGARPEMHDVDLDGCPDLVMASSPDSLTPVSTQAPLVYRNNGSGQFSALPPEMFLVPDFNGTLVVFADVNGDGAIDLISPISHNGPDGEHRTADDYTTLVTALNTTSTGPVRCGE